MTTSSDPRIVKNSTAILDKLYDEFKTEVFNDLDITSKRRIQYKQQKRKRVTKESASEMVRNLLQKW